MILESAVVRRKAENCSTVDTLGLPPLEVEFKVRFEPSFFCLRRAVTIGRQKIGLQFESFEIWGHL